MARVRRFRLRNGRIIEFDNDELSSLVGCHEMICLTTSMEKGHGMWQKLPAIEGGPFVAGCVHARPIETVAPMDMMIGVGFGIAEVTCDGVIVYSEHELKDDADYWDTQKAEDYASRLPDHDWRIVIDGPLSGQTYQRQDVGKWVLVEKNEGFA